MSQDRLDDLADLTVDVLATLRLTRFLTTDKLGDTLIVSPATRWANANESQDGWRHKLVEGLECSYCVSVHAAFWALAIDAMLPEGRTKSAFKLTKKALAISYIVGHVSHKID